ncbi:hypothetical protein CIHG_07286 [Coccidioides immitis H538.4]|uniref:Uncharacterized protein n=1 Tax=Coccidioides immitis H538.4 TaxID=396776 RepID=A0A0J8RZ85_COCIT|nr:hypothetical protein CIHG_07286 [Coccidioides immitis H538.4]
MQRQPLFPAVYWLAGICASPQPLLAEPLPSPTSPASAAMMLEPTKRSSHPGREETSSDLRAYGYLSSHDISLPPSSRRSLKLTLDLLSVIFLAQFVLAVISCLPTEETRERQREKREKLETLAELKSLKSPCYPNFYQGENGLQPITPRTMAFNQLGGANDLPLRGDTTSSSVTTLEAAKPAQPMMYFPPPPKKAAGKGKVSYA